MNKSAGKDSEGSEKHSKENLDHLRECVNHQKQIVHRNIAMLNMLLVRAWEGNEEHDIEIGKKRRSLLFSGRKHSCIVPYGHVKTELISNELVYPAEWVFKQSIEGVSCFLAAYIKKIQ